MVSTEPVYMGALATGVRMLSVARWLRSQDFTTTTTDWMVHPYGDSRALRTITSGVAMLVTLVVVSLITRSDP